MNLPNANEPEQEQQQSENKNKKENEKENTNQNNRKNSSSSLFNDASAPYGLYREGRWPTGRADVLEPGGPGFDSSSGQPQVVAHQH